MQSMFFCVLVVAVVVSVNTRRLTFNEYGMPIRVVDTSYGQGNRERIDYIEAEIHPHHLTINQRINFPTSGQLEAYYQAIRAPGDERGHLVASQFSGPPEWYNLSPQNTRVNRHLEFQSITTDWYGTECEVRRYFEYGGNRYVKWRVKMTYVGDSNRPHEYHLQERTELSGFAGTVPAIDTNTINILVDGLLKKVAHGCESSKITKYFYVFLIIIRNIVWTYN